MKLLKKNIRDILTDIGLGRDYLDKIPKHRKPKQKQTKWDYIKLKPSKQTIIEVKTQPTE
jgi:hypothetical protein